jgi:MoaA/NifB/PqqE/SkfB family radical SAM enzyme
MSFLTPLARTPGNLVVLDNTRRFARIADRFHYYRKIALSAWGFIPLETMLCSHFTWLLPESGRPASVTVELTNYCNLQCPYCTSPLGLRERGFMAESTLERFVEQVRGFRIPRVRIVGNGESTLHPKFTSMVKALAKSCRYLQMVTNGQRLTEEIIGAILSAPVRLLEISADSNNKDGYESARQGGNFEKLLSNLALLNRMKREMRAPTLVNIRAMIAPSQRSHQQEILSFWRQHADSAMPQYLLDSSRVAPDVFRHFHNVGLVPRCTYPSRSMMVHWNGRVPLCEASRQQTGIPDGLVVGNICEKSLREIWQSHIFRQYRAGHRTRNANLTPICRGCVGA